MAASHSRILSRSSWGLLSPLLCLAVMGIVVGRNSPAAGAAPEPHAVVELFPAIDAGQLQVRYQPRNERSAHVQIRNVSSQPLTVRLPEVFAARPVLAQQGFPFGNNSNNSSSNAPQSVAGPFSVNSNRGGNNNQIPNIFNQFNIAPEALVQFDVQSVCLEYGHPTPSIGMRYELTPLSAVVEEPEILTGVLLDLREQKITHKSAQAAAWHASELSGHMSWQKLAELKGDLTTTGRHPYFSPNELKQARTIVERLETARDVAQTDRGYGGVKR